ncbi:MAG: hypothetical protein ACIAQU_09210 [Phycisphaerales bacterium JB064]
MLLVCAAGAPNAVAAQHGPDPLIAPYPEVLPLRLLPIDSIYGPAGSLGFTFEGSHEDQRIGGSIAPAGDVNGDGIDDIVVHASGSSSGSVVIEAETFVVFGALGGPGAVLRSDAIDGSNGFRIDGSIRSSDVHATGVGDFNGDGHDDFLVGRPHVEFLGREEAGEVGVLFGPVVTDGRATLDLNNIPEGAVQWIYGGLPGERLGLRVAAAGDVNGDGLADVLMSRRVSPLPGASQIYTMFLVYGRRADATGRWPAIDLAAPGIDHGVLLYHRFGGLTEPVGIGDVNGDGYDDLAMGARDAAPLGRPQAGLAFVVFGGPDLPTTIDATRLDAPLATRIEGAAERDSLGWPLAGIGDFDGDGIDDLAVAANTARPRSGGYANGQTYVLFGASGTRHWPAVIDMADPMASGIAQPLVIAGTGRGDRIGSALASPGDLNGDGHPDLAVGMSGFPSELVSSHSWQRSGATMLIFGRGDGMGAAGFGTTIVLPDIEPSIGVRLHGRALGDSGGDLAAAGDFNGDGRSDLVIADARHAVDGLRAAGEVQVVYGRKPCRANLDGDDRLSLLDFLAFQNLFATGDTRADFDGDGELTVFDFLDFQTVFDAGCE